MKSFFKIVGAVFAILFTWAAYLQYNDPDATIWYVIYGLAAFASVLFVANRLTFTIATIFCLISIKGAYKQWPVQFQGFAIGEGDIENIERGREACGLLIIALVMLVYALRIRFVKGLKI
ncbi:transmembrane 220 family protein [Zobellia barbeyronii]|uniref:Transmembrane 220 family protein n=1 Tax=Zobellia barbeyronii TaxID=2748009 RepID=A0ABS5WE31_9FLAO|nr:transmembrane 220 family protein [Zobellia barbeyronii]MBT2161657.1 transmembrane 220 family protein [Zobellia barbeyronii]